MTPTDPDEIVEIIDQRPPPTSWVKYVVFGVVVLVLIGCVYRLLLNFAPRAVSGAVTAPFAKGAELTAQFLQHAGNFLTTANTSTRTEIEVGRVSSADKSGPLIVARQELLLKFTNVDERIFGTSTAEVRATGRAYYYVPLLGPGATWQIETFEKDGVRACIVHAPALRVLLPVNLDTRSLEIRTSTGALRTNDREMSAAALADLTPRLNREAIDHEVNARAAARRTIAAFMQRWLLESGSWGNGRLNAIQVVFPDESPAQLDFAIPGFRG